MKNDQMLFGNRWTNIVFENRNTAYGAYVLRQEHERNTAIALFSVLFGATLLFSSMKLYTHFFSKAQVVYIETILKTQEIELPIREQVIEKTPPPKGSLPKDNREQALQVVAQTQDVENKDSVVADDQLAYADNGAITTDIGISTGEIGGGGLVPVATVEPPKEIKAPAFVDVAEVMPSFPGGERALFSFIQQNLNYPNRERDLGIEGTTIISFVVNTDGKVSQVKTLRTDSRGFSVSSEDVISKLPKFKPGQQGGKTVAVRMAIPIKFKIQ